MQDLAPEIGLLDPLHTQKNPLKRALKKIGIQECPVRNTLLSIFLNSKSIFSCNYISKTSLPTMWKKKL